MTLTHLWHFLLPTWIVKIKACFPPKLQDKYIKHIQSSGIQPYKITIESKIEIAVFLQVIALCFGLEVQHYWLNDKEQFVLDVYKPTRTTDIFVFSTRASIGSKQIHEPWIKLKCLTTEIVASLHKVYCSSL